MIIAEMAHLMMFAFLRFEQHLLAQVCSSMVSSPALALIRLMSQSIPTGYIPRATPGDSLKKIARGSGFDF